MQPGCRRLIAGFLFAAASLCLSWPLPTQADEPSPAAVAAWIKTQIKDERLKVEFYDPLKPPKRFPGWTDFEFRVIYEYDYRFAMHTKKKQKIGVIEIRPKFTRVDMPVTNRTLLPNSLEGETWYQSALAKHELEHIRVGLHPRLVLLTRHLVEKIEVIEVPAASLSEVTREWIAKHVDEAVAIRKDAVQAFVTRINAKIDSVTRHGATPYPDLDLFLDSLYLKENLDEFKFPYLSEVLDLIESPDYKKARIAIPEPGDKSGPVKSGKSTEKS
ncbi:MAG: hypothetical protein JWP89_3289 [Schlesneria sp.]|nr:hypothetical protein [Schlesneria sp.]